MGLAHRSHPFMTDTVAETSGKDGVRAPLTICWGEAHPIPSRIAALWTRNCIGKTVQGVPAGPAAPTAPPDELANAMHTQQ
jgi:hypothetical protein